jgi:hypothetical protein
MKPIRPTKSKNSLRPITSKPIPTRILNRIMTVLSPSPHSYQIFNRRFKQSLGP